MHDLVGDVQLMVDDLHGVNKDSQSTTTIIHDHVPYSRKVSLLHKLKISLRITFQNINFRKFPGHAHMRMRSRSTRRFKPVFIFAQEAFFF